jgi:hypothetical protein
MPRGVGVGVVVGVTLQYDATLQYHHSAELLISECSSGLQCAAFECCPQNKAFESCAHSIRVVCA